MYVFLMIRSLRQIVVPPPIHPVSECYTYSEAFLNQTLNKTESCTNQTLNLVPMQEILVNLTCINRTPVYSEHISRSQGSSLQTGLIVISNTLKKIHAVKLSSNSIYFLCMKLTLVKAIFQTCKLSIFKLKKKQPNN